MEAVPPIERIVSPQTAELSRRFNAASEAIASVATRGKGQIVAACQRARDKLGPAAIPAAAAVAAAALGAIILADSRKRKHRSKHDWRALCRASIFIPIPSLARLCDEGAPIEAADDGHEVLGRSRIGSVVGVIGEDHLVRELDANPHSFKGAALPTHGLIVNHDEADRALALLFGTKASPRSDGSTGVEASVCGDVFTTGAEPSGKGLSKNADNANEAGCGPQTGMMMLRARGSINAAASGALKTAPPPASAAERATTYDCVTEIVASLSEHVFFVVGSLTVDEQRALEEVLIRASRTNTPVTVLHLIPGCNNMDQLLSAFHHQLDSLYRNAVGGDGSRPPLHPTSYKDYAFCACPSRMAMATNRDTAGMRQHHSIMTKHYAVATESESAEAIRQIRNELLLLLRGATAFEPAKSAASIDGGANSVFNSPIDLIRRGMQKTLVRYCAVVAPAAVVDEHGDAADTAAASPLVEEAAECCGDDGLMTVDVVKARTEKAPSWGETICRKIGLTRTPRRDYEARLVVRAPTPTIGQAGKVVPVTQSLMAGEPSLVPRSSVYETLDRDGRTIVKHIDIEAPGVSFDDVEVSVVKREWLSCMLVKPVPEDAPNRCNFTENTIAYGSVHRWFWLGSPTMASKTPNSAGDDAGIMYRPVPQPNGISLFNGVLSIQLYRIDTSHVVKQRANHSVTGCSAVTSTTTGQSKLSDTHTTAKKDISSADEEWLRGQNHPPLNLSSVIIAAAAGVVGLKVLKVGFVFRLALMSLDDQFKELMAMLRKFGKICCFKTPSRQVVVATDVLTYQSVMKRRPREFSGSDLENIMDLVNMSTTESYEDGDKFMPERWLTPSGDSIDEEKRLELIAFGFGPRQCPGKHLALKQLLCYSALLLRHFDDFRLAEQQAVSPKLSNLVSSSPHNLVITMKRRSA
ncbi:hypothetical protein FOZ62_028428 [Perkinsus olseni]|uniref:Cytochrome P450 n=1 Tax=Perkinsus olseni TaxID=32597 RepID=A0A7J6PTI4_PEROL|nr:hypothetical protein FOZ62_028428 [Perkinsus olseni]